ncbi:MAG: cytochrome c biogenesis protein CcdA [Termitinemataceae bacterium]
MVTLIFEFLAAAVAGLLSFLSPCVFPLVPSYLAMLSGSSVKELEKLSAQPRHSEDIKDSTSIKDGSLRKKTVVRALAFSTGFTLVFVSLGLAFSQASTMIGSTNIRLWSVLGGIIIIILGLDTLFDLLQFLRYEKRFQIARRPQGIGSSFLFGAAFGAGWSPCVGPMLASILLLAGTGSILKAALLLITYSVGLALPFLLISVFLGSLRPLIEGLKKHMATVKIVSGILLIVIGLYMILGDLRNLSSTFARVGYGIEYLAENHGNLVRIITTLIYALAGVWSLIVSRATPTKGLLGYIFPSLLFLLALLEGFGFIQSLTMIASWMLFQGL